MKALLIIDVQNDFLPGGSLAVADGDAVIPVINLLSRRFGLVLATQDWHPPGHHSFASSHPNTKAFETIELNGLKQVLWPDHCVQGSFGAEFSANIDLRNAEAIFRKGMEMGIDSYSGFYDNGHKKSTGLAAYLHGRSIKEVYIAGLAADFCVYFSAMDALKEGFQVRIIEDATKAISPEGREKAWRDIVDKGGIILHSSQV